jgi:hypothetical protein
MRFGLEWVIPTGRPGVLATVAAQIPTTTATLRAHLVNIPARIARSARRPTLHPPEQRRWRDAFTELFDAAHAPPVA